MNMMKRTWIFLSVVTMLLASVSRADAAFFQMKDGSFYDPSTGLAAPTAESLAQLIAEKQGIPITVTSTPVIVASPTELTPPSAVAPAPAADQFALKQAMVTARTFLQAQIDAAKKPTPTYATTDTDWRQVTLAVWSKSQNIVQYVDIDKKGTQVRLRAGFATPIVTVSNGVNSAYRFKDPESVVVAVRYPLYNDVGTAKKKKFEIQEVVYSPYSSAIHTPEMVALGKSLMDGYEAQVYGFLRDHAVPSRGMPDKLLADVLDPATARSVFLIEHADAKELEVSPNTVVERFYVTLAANEKDVYAYSKSSAGALGLAQFMPATYKSLVKIRPELGLMPGFEAGMRDPVNAMKAEVGYLDYLIAALPDKVQRSTELSQLHEFAVGAYNGGPARVSQAVAEWEQILDGSRAKRVTSLTQQSNALTATASSLKKKILAEEDPDIWKPMQKKLNATRIELAKVTNQLATLKKSTLKKETVDYILKYRFALEWFEKERAAVASVPATTVASL
jgi:hypothetical protein